MKLTARWLKLKQGHVSVTFLLVALIGLLVLAAATTLLTLEKDQFGLTVKLTQKLKQIPSYLDPAKVAGAEIIGDAIGSVLLPDGRFTGFKILEADSSERQFIGETTIQFLNGDILQTVLDKNEIENFRLKDGSVVEKSVVIDPIAISLRLQNGQELPLRLIEATVKDGRIDGTFQAETYRTGHIFAGEVQKGKLVALRVGQGGEISSETLLRIIQEIFDLYKQLAVKPQIPLPGAPQQIVEVREVIAPAEKPVLVDIATGSGRFQVTPETVAKLPLDLPSVIPSVGAIITKDSVTSEIIKDGEVKTADIGDGAVTDSKITQITSKNKVAGSAIQLAQGGGLVNSDGLSLNRSCNASQTLSWNGTDWVCSDSGDITGVTAGAGLTAGGTSGEVTVDVGAGTGISVNANDIAINLAFTPTWVGLHTFSGGLNCSDCIDGNDLADTIDLDNDTLIRLDETEEFNITNAGAGGVVINLTDVGDFVTQTKGTNVATFGNDGSLTYNLPVGTQDFNIAGLDADSQFILSGLANCNTIDTNSSGALLCGTDEGGGTFQQAYDGDADGGNAIVALTAADDSIILRNPASGGTDSGYILNLDQLNTGAVDGLRIANAGTGSAITVTLSNASGTRTNGLLIEQTGAGTTTNAIQIAETAGTITDGILITGTLGNIINSGSIDITGGGAIAGATAVTSSGTITFSGLVSCNTVDTNASGVLACGTDEGGSGTTLQATYDADADGGDAVIAETTADDSIIFRNPATAGTDSGFVFHVEQLNTGAVDALRISESGTGFDITTGTANQDLDITANGTGNIVLSGDADTVVSITSAASLSEDQLSLSGGSTTTDAIDALSIAFTQADDLDATDTNALLNLAATSSSLDADTLLGINIAAITASTPTEVALRIGTGWDTVLDSGELDISGVGTLTDSGGAVIIDDDLTITTGTTISAASITALNCSDCIDGDDLTDTIAADANFAISMDGTETFTLTQGSSGNAIVNLSSTGDLVVQDAGTAVLTVADDSSFTYALPAGTVDFTVSGLDGDSTVTFSGLNSCDTIDTTAGGVLFCGTDAGASPAWSSLTNPTANLTINHVAAGADRTTTFNWTDFTSNSNFFTFNFDNNGGTAGTDQGVVIANAVSTATTGDLNTEAVLLLDQADTITTGTTAVDDALLITNSGGSTLTDAIQIGTGTQAITNAINIASTGVTTDISLQNAETISNDTDGTVAIGGTTFSIASATALNCTDCIDGDDLADTIAADANFAISMDGTETFTITQGSSGNAIVNLSSTGDLVVQDAGTAVLTVADDSSFTYALPAGTVDFTVSGLDADSTVTFSGLNSCDTIDSTASGVLACGVDAGGGTVAWSSLVAPTANLSLAHAAFTTTFGWTSTGALDAWTVNFNNNSTTATTQDAMVINNAAVGTFTDLNTENLLLLQQLDTTTTSTTVVDNALKIDAAASSGITDGIEITNSAGNVTNAINIVDTGGGTITTGISMSGIVTTGISMSGSFAELINTPNFDVAGGGSFTFANTTATNSIVNLTSTGDFVVQDGGVAVLTVADDSSFTYALPAGTVDFTVSGLDADSTVTFSGLNSCDTIDSTAGGVLTCGTDAGAAATTLKSAYDADADGGDAIIALTTADDSLIFRNPATSGTDSGYALWIEQLNTGAIDALRISESGTGFDITTGTADQSLDISANGTGDVVFNLDSDTPVVFSGGTTDITTGTNEDLTINVNGTGDFLVNVEETSIVAFTDSSIAVTQDAVGVNLQGQTTTTGADGLVVIFTNGDDLDATDVNVALSVLTEGFSLDADTLIGVDINDQVGGGAPNSNVIGLRIGAGTSGSLDVNLQFNDVSTIVELVDTGTLTLRDTASNNILVLQDIGNAANHTINLDSDTALSFSQAAGGTDLTTGTNETLTIEPNGTGDTVINIDGGTNLQITATAAPSADMVAISNAGQGVTTGGLDGLSITYVQGISIDAITGGALDISVTQSGEAGDTIRGITINAITAGSSTETAIFVGTGWDTVLDSGELDISGVGTLTDSGGAVTIDDDLTITTGTTLSATSITALNCTDCIDGDDLADSLTVDASLTITTDAAEAITFSHGGSGNIIFNLTSTGDFVVQDAGTAVFTVGDQGFSTYAAPASSEGNNAFAFTNIAGSGTSYDILDIALTSASDDAGADTQRAMALVITGPTDSEDTTVGLAVEAVIPTSGSRVAIDIPAIVAGAGTETALRIGTGWDTVLDSGELDISGVGNITDSGGDVVIDDNLTISTGTTITATSVTALNCTDCIDFDDLADSLTVDASLTITTDAAEAITFSHGGSGNIIFNLTSTGDFVVQDGGTAVLTVADDSSFTYALPAGTVDFTVSGLDADSTVTFSGLNSCDTIDTNASGVLACGVDAGAGASPFGSSGGVITKTTAADFLSLRYGDAADIQLEIENTTAATIPTADAVSVNLSGGTTGIVTAGVDGIYVLMEVSDISAGGTISGMQIDIDTVGTPTANDTFVGLNIAALNAATSAVERAIEIGGTWDVDITSSNATDLNIGAGTTGDIVFAVDADTPVVLSGGAATDVDLSSGTNENLVFDANGTGNYVLTGLVSCNTIDTDASGVLSCGTDGGAAPDTASFVDTTPAAMADNNTTELFNDATRPNITTDTTTATVLVSVQINDPTAVGADDEYDAVRVWRRNDNTNPTCNGASPNTAVGTIMEGGFVTATTHPWGLSGTFLDEPAAADNIRYTVCTSAQSVGTVDNTPTEVRVVLVELGADLAENFYATDETIEPGDLVAIDFNRSAGVKKTTRKYDPQVLGIVSTTPALTLNDATRFGYEKPVVDGGAREVPIALSGRVPVKVSTENGRVKAGDLLTPSSLPGVAMRATKAGIIIGQALSDFNYPDDTVGLVAAFVKTDYWAGLRVTDLMPQQTPSGELILAQFVAQKQTLQESLDLSEIVTDRVSAGLEVITPQVTTKNVTTESLESLPGSNITVNLDGTGQLVLRSKFGEVGATIDAKGNAMFGGDLHVKGNAVIDGELVVKKLKAGEIEGLVDLEAQLNDLAQRVAGVETKVDELSSLTAEQATKNMDIVVINQAEFTGKATFKGEVAFENAPIFNKDTAGTAVVKAGETKVEVTFEKEYAAAPTINANPVFDQPTGPTVTPEQLDEIEKQFFLNDIRHLVSRRTTKGFAIVLNKPAPTDVTFSWIALVVKDAAPAATPAQPAATPPPTEPPPINQTSQAAPATPAVPVPPQPTQTLASPLRTLVVNPDVGFLRARQEASATSAEIGRVEPGQTLRVIEDSNNWYKVELVPGQVGWVSGQYVTLN